MFTTDPLDALVLARQHGRRLHAQAAAERLRGASTIRTAVAASLRRAADRLDPAPRARRPASQLCTIL
jgi:hypothetical protein